MKLLGSVLIALSTVQLVAGNGSGGSGAGGSGAGGAGGAGGSGGAGSGGSGGAGAPVNECANPSLNNCDSNAVCIDTASSFTCACNPGFSGDGVSCSDIDECNANTNNCDTNAACINTPGSFTCTCGAAFYGDGVICLPKTNNFASQDVGSECLNGWTYQASTRSCDLPTDVTDQITCSATSMGITIQPSDVFDDITVIPNDVLNSMKIQIAGQTGGYSDFITFANDNGADNEKTESQRWDARAPFMSTVGGNIVLAYKFKVSEPTISFGANSIFTTRQANEFYIRCLLPTDIDISTGDVIVQAPDLGAARNGTASSAIDTSTIFELKTYTDAGYGTEGSSFDLGSKVYSFIDGSNLATLPPGIDWGANDCKVCFNFSFVFVPV